MTTETHQFTARPWSARKPQSLILSLLITIIAGVLIWQGFTYISDGRGGLVPFLIVLGAPALAGYYLWYFNIYRFDETEQRGRAGL